MPAEGESAPWWPFLTASGARRAADHRPPAFRDGAATRATMGGEAFVIGQGELEPTGADRSFVVLETRGELQSRAAHRRASMQAGLAVTLFAVHEAAGAGELHLIEIDDARHRARSAAAGGASGRSATSVARVAWLGGYARPFAAAALERGGDG